MAGFAAVATLAGQHVFFDECGAALAADVIRNGVDDTCIQTARYNRETRRAPAG